MIPRWLERWGEIRRPGRNAFVARFLLRRWLWHSALMGGLYGFATFWFSSSVLQDSVLDSTVQGLLWFAAVVVVMMPVGYAVALLIWRLNERRFAREVNR